MASQVSADKIASRSSGVAFTLPTADGTANQHLKTDGSGALGWATPPTGIALTGSTATWIPTITGADALTGTANFTYDGNTLDVKNSGTASSIKVYCESSNAHYQEIKAAPHAGSSNWTLTLPGVVPTASGQALTATTAGVASWYSLGTPRWHGFLPTDQSITNDTATKITMTSEYIDTDSAYDAANAKFVVPAGAAGDYYVYLNLRITNTANVNVQAQIHVNGAISRRSIWIDTDTASNDTSPFIGSIIQLAETNYVEAYVYCTFASGTTYVDNAGTNDQNYFGGWKLG